MNKDQILQINANLKYIEYLLNIFDNESENITLKEIKSKFQTEFKTKPILLNQYFGIIRLLPLILIKETYKSLKIELKGDIEKIKEDPALTTSQKIVDGYEMFCYENATPEEDSTALVKDGYKTMGCFFREGIMSYSIGFVVNYKVREKINVFNAMVDSFKLIDKMNHSELERI